MRRQSYQEIAENNQEVVVHIARCTCIAGLAEGEALRFTENLGLSFNILNRYVACGVMSQQVHSAPYDSAK